MRRLLLTSLALTIALTFTAAAQAQQRPNIGLLCTDATKSTPDQQITACTRIIGMKAFTGDKLADVYFGRATGWNRKGDYTRVIEDTTEAIRIQPKATGVYNLRGSAYYDKGEYDIAIADFNEALKLNGPHPTLYHNRANAYRGKNDLQRALEDYSEAIKLDSDAYSWQNRGVVKTALGDLEGAQADLNEAVRKDPQLASVRVNRAVMFRAKGDLDRALADADEAVKMLREKAPKNYMTPPGSVWVNANFVRGAVHEARGEYDLAKQDYKASIDGNAPDAGSKSAQATARVRLELLSKGAPPPPTMRANTSDGGRRVALVIGNGAYAHVTALPNPANDARAIAKSLRDLGFEVSEGFDLDAKSMKKTADDFLLKAAGAHTALLYYAGHGVQIDGRNYLVPVDVKLTAETNPAQAMTDMDSLLIGLDDQVRTNILIFDACRNNPMAQQVAAAGSSRSIVASGLAAPTAPTSGATRGAGTLIAFATAPGQVALDGEGANSPFSMALSRHIGTPGLELQAMLTRVRAEVVAGTKGAQVPWSNSSLLGEVFLAKP